MRVTFNSSFDEGLRAISQAAEAMSDAERQVATGLRLARLSQDPLGTAAAVVEHANLDRLEAYKGAGDAASYRLGLADTVLSDILNQLTAAQTTALSARGSAPTQAQRDAAANELLAIRDALMGDINTRFQGAYLFSGSSVTTAPYVVSGGAISAYQGDTDASVIDIGSDRTVASTFDGGQIFQGSDTVHILDALTDLAAAISINDQAAIDAGVQALGRAFDRATSAQARIGNDLKTLDETRSLMSAARIGSVARLSTIEDADLAEAGSRLAQAQTAYRAALAAMATIGRISLMDYLK